MHVEVLKMFVENFFFYSNLCCCVVFVACLLIYFFFFQVWYLESPSDGPPGISCSSINLYTVPV